MQENNIHKLQRAFHVIGTINTALTNPSNFGEVNQQGTNKLNNRRNHTVECLTAFRDETIPSLRNYINKVWLFCLFLNFKRFDTIWLFKKKYYMCRRPVFRISNKLLSIWKPSTIRSILLMFLEDDINNTSLLWIMYSLAQLSLHACLIITLKNSIILLVCVMRWWNFVFVKLFNVWSIYPHLTFHLLTHKKISVFFCFCFSVLSFVEGHILISS